MLAEPFFSIWGQIEGPPVSWMGYFGMGRAAPLKNIGAGEDPKQHGWKTCECKL